MRNMSLMLLLPLLLLKIVTGLAISSLPGLGNMMGMGQIWNRSLEGLFPLGASFWGDGG